MKLFVSSLKTVIFGLAYLKLLTPYDSPSLLDYNIFN